MPDKADGPKCESFTGDGFPCMNQAKFIVSRPFSGIESAHCGVHQPAKLSLSQGHVKMVLIGGNGS